MSEERVREFLGRIKVEGRSSPVGQHWDAFFKLLTKHRNDPSEPSPPVPLILAASGESNASKYERLSAQLNWAMAHDCLDEALEFLGRLEGDKWNAGRLEDWEKDSYWTEG